jgi:hypothetical protein
MEEGECVALCIPKVSCCILLELLLCADSRMGTFLYLLVVFIVDIHLLLDLVVLKSVLQRLRVSLL